MNNDGTNMILIRADLLKDVVEALTIAGRVDLADNMMRDAIKYEPRIVRSRKHSRRIIHGGPAMDNTLKVCGLSFDEIKNKGE